MTDLFECRDCGMLFSRPRGQSGPARCGRCAELALARADVARLRDFVRRAPHLDDCALQHGSSCSCGKTALTREDAENVNV